jgi:predicted outer membrane repeat protein
MAYDRDGGSITINNVVCYSNRASGTGGGAIAATDDNVVISNSEFINNEATTGNGGAILFTDWSTSGCSVSNSNFTGNTAAGEGNAIFGTSGSKFSLSKNNVSGGQADIVSEGEVTSQINVTIYDANTSLGVNATLTAKVTDDNGNLINCTNLYFTVSSVVDDIGPAVYNPLTGNYEFEKGFDLSVGEYDISMKYTKELTYLRFGTLTITPKRGTFTDLRYQIENTPYGQTLNLTYDFAYNGTGVNTDYDWTWIK